MAHLNGKLIFAALLILLLQMPVSGADSRLYTAQNAQFEIVGLHSRSVNYVEELSRHIVVVAARYLDPGGLQFPQRILVSLKPPEFANFEGNYSVRYAMRGFVNLDIRWEASTSLLATCRALAEALLVRYSIFNYGQAGPGFLPKWPATAIGTKAYLKLRPAQSQRLSVWSDLSATPHLAALIGRKWDAPVVDLNGYLFLLAMERELERREVRILMGQSIAGANIVELLAERIPSSPEADPMDFDAWWRASFLELQAPAEGVMETMAVSRAWIEALGELGSAELKDLNLAQLWNERENVEVRGLIEARYEIIKLRIARVNPAYFNAARSLGALFETYLMGEHRHKYIFNLSVFLGDFEDSKALEVTVGEALNAPDKR